MRQISIACFIAGSAVASLARSAPAQNVVVLPSLGGAGAIANDINDDGVVVGQSVAPLSGGLIAMRWDASRVPVNLGMLAGHVSAQAYAINNAGQIVGYSEDSTGARHATLWDGTGGIIDVHAAIGSSGSSIPWDINDAGLVVGQASINPGFAKGFVWQIGTSGQVAGGLDGYTGSRNLAVNNSNVIVGSSFFFGDPDDAHRANPDGRGGWDSVQIGPTGYEMSVASGISPNGTIVGYTTFHSTTDSWNAVIFDGDHDVIVLGTLPGLDTSEAYDVNDHGLIVGQAFDGSGIGLEPHAFAYYQGVMHDLNDLLNPDSAFEVLLGANAVNAHNDIVGFGRLNDGTIAGFLIEHFGDTLCKGDFNQDGLFDFFDVQAFLQAFADGDTSADFTGDGLFDFFDVQEFLNVFSGQCL
ncbi:MAG: hypothetical protein Kow0022_11810 [Phycisphaerales bacterium]